MRILLAEDEIRLSNALKKILEDHGYKVDAVSDGESAVDFATLSDYDLIILDVMMPKLDGFEALKKIRAAKIASPTLMLTAKSQVSDKVNGLNIGADDYMTKPFDTEELLARVRALTRRSGDIVLNEIQFGDLKLDLKTASLSCNGESINLSFKEFETLKMLLKNANSITDADSIIVNVWGADSDATYNNVEVYISFLRKKLKYLNSRLTIKKAQKIGYFLEKEK